jgi:hypothetical protein
MRATSGAKGAKPHQREPYALRASRGPRWAGLAQVGGGSRTKHGQLTHLRVVLGSRRADPPGALAGHPTAISSGMAGSARDIEAKTLQLLPKERTRLAQRLFCQSRPGVRARRRAGPARGDRAPARRARIGHGHRHPAEHRGARSTLRAGTTPKSATEPSPSPAVPSRGMSLEAHLRHRS